LHLFEAGELNITSKVILERTLFDMAVFVHEPIAQAVVYERGLPVGHHHIQWLNIIVCSTLAMDQLNNVDKLLYHIEDY
tara:strand:+ start:159 stop:395 length:237 start_codon:yes stop_codon:yes gene_type:complete